MLEDAPYTHLATLQRQEPISWIDSLGLWVVSRHADVREILLDHDRFGTGAPTSPVRMTFGTQMLSVDGDLHSRYRQAAQSAFRPATLKARLELAIRAAARGLIDEWRAVPRVDLRRCFAARLPVSTMLALAGLPAAAEAPMRDWYEIFATALASYQPTAALRAQAAQAVSELHTYLQDAIRKVRAEDPGNLLQDLVMATGADRLSDEEICRNLSIIFFGGISTVEAVILNTLWALAQNPALYERVSAEPALIARAVDESIRWLSPVQSATRKVLVDCEFHGTAFRAGEVVNCMLGAANRDPAVFVHPDRYDIDRPDLSRHLAFATGGHACLGFQLARMEARIALEELLVGLPGLQVDLATSSAPRGAEFHQCDSLTVVLNTAPP